ncbi:MAG: hypothetical protein R2867_16580 [Caldilineaceae bacterium]
MNEQDGLDELIRALFVGETRAEEGVHPPAVGAAAQQAAAIAQSRRLIQALGAVSTVLTGEASMIDGAAAAYMTCEECIAELPGYVEAWLAGEALEKRYSALHRHLRACPNCQEQALALRTLLQSAATSAPTYPTFAQLRQQLAAQPATALWQRTASRSINSPAKSP